MARAFLIIEALELENQRKRETLHISRLRSLRDRHRIEKKERKIVRRVERSPLDLSETQFIAHYRVSKKIFKDLCSELTPLLPKKFRRTKVSIESKVLAALSFYATGSYQKPVGMTFLQEISQPSISKAVRDVTLALNDINILRKYIHFPRTQQERKLIVDRFFNKFGFPGVLGCIDTTHVALVQPNEYEEWFFNSKHYHSRNVQIICDSQLNILSVDASFGGSTSDAEIWENGPIVTHLRHLHRTAEFVWLLGDSAYPDQPYLLTPIANAEVGSAEEHYNGIHSKATNTVVQCISVLKARWRCLLAHRVLHYDHDFVAKIINACCVLHNIANQHQLPVPEMPAADSNADLLRQIHEEKEFVDEQEQLEKGRRQKSIIAHRLWTSRQNICTDKR